MLLSGLGRGLRAACLCAGLLAAPALSQALPALSGEAQDSTGAGAGFGPPGSGFLETRLGWFEQPDSGDANPFLDESLSVIEPIVVFDYNFSERFGIDVKLSYDHVSSASIDRLSNFPEQSGASGDFYFGADIALRHLLNERTRLGWHVSFGKEYDYSSLGLGASLTRDLPERQASLSLSLDAFLDQVDIIRFDGSSEGSDNRTSVAATVAWQQALSPRWRGELGLTVAQQTGFLETPYNAVVLEDPALPPNPNLENQARGTEITEELPDTRLRLALFGRARHAWDERTAIELGGRLYWDDWGIEALTFEPRLYRELVRDLLLLRLRYRFHVQTEADHYGAHFTQTQEFRTQDSDLADFSAHGLGFQFLWRASQNSQLDFGADYGLRSDGLDHFFGSLGWRWSF